MRSSQRAPENLGKYLRVAEAARLLGVSPSTLRNWDRTGKLKPLRHPFNNYRLYERKALEELLRSLARDEE
jgi:excisionase family DNA binding protein